MERDDGPGGTTGEQERPGLAALSEMFGKVVDAGMNVLVKEGGVLDRASVARELGSAIAGQFERTLDRAKVEAVRVIGREYQNFLERANVTEEVIKVLEGVTIEIDASISFRRRTSADQPRLVVRSRSGKRRPASTTGG